MIIMKMNLPRRTFLRGMGITVALPFLDAMTPALAAAEFPALRLAFFGGANGVHGPHFRPNNGEAGPITEMSPILQSLEPLKDQVVVVSGLSNARADSIDSAGGPHARAAGSFLSGMRAKRTEGSDVELGTTIDQYAAAHLGKDTPITSVNLAVETSFVGNCDQGYSCAYVNTFSWRTPTMPLPPERNPRLLFEQLFGDGGSVAARRAENQKDRSILDWVMKDMTRLQQRLGVGDRTMVNDYLTAIREVEQRIQKTEKHQAESPLPTMGQPLGIPDSYDEHAKLLQDLMLLAYQGDITRVFTYQTSREQTDLTYPTIGVPEAHHSTSHHGGDPYLIEQNTKINAYHVSLYSRLAEKMRNIKDGDGSLLDHSILFYSWTLGDGDLHSAHNLPVILTGGGCGQMKGRRYLKYPLETPMMNLGLTLLDKAGVHMERIGDSTGRLTDL